MRQFGNKRNVLAIIVMALLLAAAAPLTSFGKDHDNDRGKRHSSDRGWWRNNRKCRKFVNCHDARDGRRDGRGPRGDRVANINPRIHMSSRRNLQFENDRLFRRNRKLDRDHANLFLRNRGRRFGRGVIVND